MKENYKAWEIEPVENPASMKKEDFYLHLVGWAILAANSHNVQPWKFILRPKESIIDVCVTPEGVLPVSDPTGRQAFISIGCAIENLAIASSNYQINCQISINEQYALYPKPAARIYLGLVTTENARLADGQLFKAIKQRRNNRSIYKINYPLMQEIILNMKKTAKERNVKLHMIQDDATRKIFAYIQSQGDGYVIANKAFRQELADYLLPNDTEKSKGMPGSTFGLNDQMAAIIHQELKKEVLNKDLAKNFAATSKAVINSSPVIGVITAPKDEPQYWIKAGMAFQKIALTAASYGNGLNVAVHAAMTEVAILNWLLKIRLGTFERPTVIFRMGYATQKMPHSPRMPAGKVTEVV